MTEVEVIVPVFNDQIRLNHLLESLALQTLDPNLFIVTIVDNGSESPIVIPGSLPYSCKLISCSIPGSYAARNAAWPARALIAFTDADCLPATWLEAGLKPLVLRIMVVSLVYWLEGLRSFHRHGNIRHRLIFLRFILECLRSVMSVVVVTV